MTTIQRFSSAGGEATGHRALTQLSWFLSGAVLAFAVPYLGSSVADLGNDLYYLVYFAAVITFVTAYALATDLDVGRLLRSRLTWSLLVGAGAAVFVVVAVLTKDATARPGGLRLLWDIAWRGVTYGTVDAILLQAFPAAVALAIVGGLAGPRRKLAFGALTLALVMAITATYHLGYAQFRDDGVRQPEVGNVAMAAPVLLTANPAGSIGAHVALHVSAVVHTYETDVFLPPTTTAP